MVVGIVSALEGLGFLGDVRFPWLTPQATAVAPLRSWNQPGPEDTRGFRHGPRRHEGTQSRRYDHPCVRGQVGVTHAEEALPDEAQRKPLRLEEMRLR